jgi:hypothetical protein
MPESGKKAFDPLDIISFLALLLAAALFFYVAFYRTIEQSRGHFARLAREADEEIKALDAARIKKAEEAAKQRAKPTRDRPTDLKGPVHDVPSLLQKINSDAIGSGLELINIEKMDDHRYRLSAYAPFDRLVQFLFRVERSNLGLEDMGIHPSPGRGDQIQLVLRMIPGEMSPENKGQLDDFEKVARLPVRNPFKKGGGADEGLTTPDRLDLTWKFKLTGIGVDRTGRYAHIDHKNVYKGDIFNGMRVTDVGKDRVELETDARKFFIAFRFKKPAGP